MQRRRRVISSKMVSYLSSTGLIAVSSLATHQVCNVPTGRDVAGAMRALMAPNVSVSVCIVLALRDGPPDFLAHRSQQRQVLV